MGRLLRIGLIEDPVGKEGTPGAVTCLPSRIGMFLPSVGKRPCVTLGTPGVYISKRVLDYKTEETHLGF